MKRLLTQNLKNFILFDREEKVDSQICTSKKYALWIGPHFESKGGVASVIKIFKSEGFFKNGHNKFIPTMEDGSKLYKLLVFFKALIIFVQKIRKAKLIHVHLSGKASFWRKSIFMFIANLLGVPVITHLHDSGFPIFYESTSDFQKKIINKALSNSNKLFVLSAEIQEFLSKLSLGVEPEIFPNPVILNTATVPRNRSEQTILFLGRIVQDKGIGELLEATAIVKAAIPSVQLIIGGDGDMDLLQKLIDHFNLHSNVTIKGWIRNKDREVLMRTSTVLVLPSYGEGQSMSVLEAMESYLPVISTNVGGNSFLIENGSSGLLVPLKDANALAAAIILILGDPSLRIELVRAARQRVEELFDSKKVISKVAELYNNY